MSRKILSFIFCGACLLQGCASSSPQSHAYPESLLDGKAAFGHPVEAAVAVDVLAVSQAMRGYIDAPIATQPLARLRLQALLKKMQADGFFADQYEPMGNYTAAETFVRKRGNCIAYTSMFVALARQAGLQASFQLVHEPPVWSVKSGFLQRTNHINVRVFGVGVPGGHADQVSVDFNSVEPEPEARRELISDAHAAALFYLNLSVEQLHQQNYEGAFAWLKRAILTSAENTDVWNNLGALYSVQQQPALAEQAYRMAHRVDPRDKTALAGLVKVLRRQGREDEASVYERRVTRYRNRNPYYHFALAEQAFSAAAYETALRSVNRAIALKSSNPNFYTLRAATAQQLGNARLEAESLALAEKYAHRRKQPEVLLNTRS